MSAPACLKPQITSPAQKVGLYDFRLAAFFSAFFSRRGNRLLFFFLSFGTFGALGLRGGASTPTSAAILPAAVPIVFAASIRTLSSASAFFVICISSTWNERDSRANGARKIRSGRTALLKQCPLLVTLSSTLPPASLSATLLPAWRMAAPSLSRPLLSRLRRIWEDTWPPVAMPNPMKVSGFSVLTGCGTSVSFPEYHNRQRRQRDVDAVRVTMRCRRLGRYHAAVPHVAASEQLRICIQNLVV